MKIAFFEVDATQQAFFTQKFQRHSLIFFTEPLTQLVPAAARDAGIISISLKSLISESVLKQFSQLRLLVTRTTGYDHIDSVAAQKQHITVTSVPTYATQAVAEFTIGLLFVLMRNIYQGMYAAMREHDMSRNGLCGTRISGKTCGIIGTGAIGAMVAQKAHALGMNVIAYDPHPKSALPVHYVSLPEVYAKSDIITLHTPLNTATHYLLNAQAFAQCKKGIMLINTARAAIVDPDALIAALEHTIVAACAFDVSYDKPTPLLTQHPAFLLTPHMAFYDTEAVATLLQETTRLIAQWIEQQKG
ncbi:MAG: NAD(P)-dependent oxidoreductase [Candidatus Babeliales bacterium]